MVAIHIISMLLLIFILFSVLHTHKLLLPRFSPCYSRSNFKFFFFLHNGSWLLIFQFNLFSMYSGLNTTISWSSSLASHPQILYWLNSLTSNVGGLQSLVFDKSCLCPYLRLFHPVKLLSLDLFSELQACITNCFNTYYGALLVAQW